MGRVQAELCRRWLAAGRRLTGYKGGLTSKAKMVQMGLETPVFGVLMGDTCVPDGDVVDMTQLIHPKVEAEIAFVTSRELSGDVSLDDVLEATVRHARDRGDRLAFKDFKFDIQSVIADNTSAARYVVGGCAAAARRARSASARSGDGAQRRSGRNSRRRCGDGSSCGLGRRLGAVAGRRRTGTAGRQLGDDRRCHRGGSGARRRSRDGSTFRIWELWEFASPSDHARKSDMRSSVRRSVSRSPRKAGRRIYRFSWRCAGSASNFNDGRVHRHDALRPISETIFPGALTSAAMRTYGHA